MTRRPPQAFALLVLLGAPVGLLWATAAPEVGIAFTAAGDPGLLDFESSQFFDVDRAFLVVSLLVGVATGVLGWRYARRRGPWAPVWLTLGCLAAAVVSREVGERYVVDERLAAYCARTEDSPLCAVYDGRGDVRSSAFVLAWPFAAVSTFGALTLVVDRDDEDEPEL